MNRVAKFYERLPRGAAPEPVASGPLDRYKLKYFGKNPSAKRTLRFRRRRRSQYQRGSEPG